MEWVYLTFLIDSSKANGMHNSTEDVNSRMEVLCLNFANMHMIMPLTCEFQVSGVVAQVKELANNQWQCSELVQSIGAIAKTNVA